MRKKVLIIVAHPDDETIWMGGTILKNNWNITIISLCRKTDKDRAPKFKRVCKTYKAKSFIYTLDDEKLNKIKTSEVKKHLKQFKQPYDIIFTHGKNGEYGHIRHKEVHNAVKEMIQDKQLKTKQLLCFSYKKNGQYTYPNKNSDKFIKLKESQIQRKREIIQKIYGFNKKSFENICCRNLETFKVIKI